MSIKGVLIKEFEVLSYSNYLFR